LLHLAFVVFEIAPNEKETSDGYRKRAPIEVEGF
jgi:hypothetical protein